MKSRQTIRILNLRVLAVVVAFGVILLGIEASRASGQSAPRPLGIYSDSAPKEGKALVMMGPAGAGPRSLRFDTNSARIDLPQATPALGDMTEKIKAPQRSGHMFLIAGHADQRGSHAVNDPLSQARAEAVRRILVNQYGIPTERIEARGYGKRHPLDPANNPVAWDANRRVELWDVTEAPKPYASASQALTLNVSVLYRDAKGNSGVLTDGLTLRSGDSYRVTFQAHQDCYVYVLQQDAKRGYCLFPKGGNGGENPVRSGETYSISPDGWVRLDDTVGEETIFVIGSRQPLKEVETRLSQLQLGGSKDLGFLMASLPNDMVFMGPGGVRQAPVGRGRTVQTGSTFYYKVRFNHR